MNVQKTPVFRSSMGGFNRKDVADYILKLNRDFEEIKARYEDEIKKLSTELTSAKEELSKLREAEAAKSAAEAEALAAKENSEITASEELSRANAVIAAQTERLDEAAREKEELEAALAKANAKLETYVDYDAKMEQYDAMANRMGEIFIGATAEADRIRSEAKAQSEALIRSTQTKCDEYRGFLEKKLDEFAAMRKNDLARLMDETQNEINILLSSFADKSREMENETLCLGFEASSVSDSTYFDKVTK